MTTYERCAFRLFFSTHGTLVVAERILNMVILLSFRLGSF